ncbi:hypothetical protein SAMN05443662_0055 [Sulfurivirga caldicuralii]|uniref:Uncharacterized protein n=1 Tax=Sulfurivirga caldicuralii TaxID=364032 RepID=A0A1N6DD90_9GAMM|nr:hypothetical protein [Sulfurivirga caldicuralii]SIN68745.1 hypothetical protein SAMN05443662_0055 [Sulfurivirga caldicuralii]
MRMIFAIPSLLWILLAYLGIVYLGGGGKTLYETIITFKLFSGATLAITTAGLLVLVGLVFLFFEVIKATRPSNISVIDHMLSTLVFIGFLIAFIAMPAAGNQFFLMLLIMSLFDVMAGFTVSIVSARRDIGLEDKQLTD